MRQLWPLFRETLRLYAVDPFGMIAVVGLRILDGKEAAQAQLEKVYEANR